MANIKKRRGSRIKEMGVSDGKKGLEEKAEKIYRGSQKNGFIRKCVMRRSGGGGRWSGMLILTDSGCH
jgi:hypothetical protein